MDSSHIRMHMYTPALAILVTFLVAVPAFAHKVGLFATVKQGIIEGEAYASGGGMLKDCPIKFLGPDDEKLGEIRTAEDGTFRFTPTAQVDHLIVLDTGDGHRAEFKISASELEDAAPLPDGTRTDSGPAPDDLDRRIADAVAKQVIPLRKQIDLYERKTRLRDVLGGIGYVFGLAGVVLYFKAGKQVRK